MAFGAIVSGLSGLINPRRAPRSPEERGEDVFFYLVNTLEELITPLVGEKEPDWESPRR